MSFDFLGIPLNGTPPQFVERLLRNGCLDTTQNIQEDDDCNNSYFVYVYVWAISAESILLNINYNPFSGMVYKVMLILPDDIGLSLYSQLFNLIVERYGEEYIKLSNKEVICWNFEDGRIILSRHDTTTVVVFSDNENNPDADFEDISDDAYLIE